MARLYADENCPLPVVDALRQLGHDVLTTREADKSGQSVPDKEVLAFACAEKRILLTFDRKHFIRLHSTRSDHAGIIVCTFDPDFDGQANRIHEELLSRGDLSGGLIRVNRPPK